MLLQIDTPLPSRKPKKTKVRLIWTSVIIGLFTLGSTFAAIININTGDSVEFGQGKVLTTACDTSITLNPTSGYVNGDTSQFALSKISLDQIDSSAPHCKGVDFHIKFYPSLGSDLLTLYTDADENPVTEIVIYDDGSQFIKYVPAFKISQIGSTGFTLDLGNVVVPVSGFNKITIETMAHVYRVAETGPSDGIVFVYEKLGFPCGPTLNKLCHNLEIAPADWFGTGEDPKLPYSTNAFGSTTVPLLNGYGPSASAPYSWDVGAGLAATLAIIAQNGPYDPTSNSYAAGAANAYQGGGYTDWHLPNFGEATAFNSVYGKLVGELGVNPTKEYWTSVECGPGGAYKIARDGSNTFYVGGCNGKYVFVHPMRPIHAF